MGKAALADVSFPIVWRQLFHIGSYKMLNTDLSAGPIAETQRYIPPHEEARKLAVSQASATKRGIKVGVLTFGDGRSFLQKPLADVNQRFLQSLVKRLEGDGFEVVQGTEIVWQNDIAVREARRLVAENV